MAINPTAGLFRLRLGAQPCERGVAFRVWAPKVRTLAVKLLTPTRGTYELLTAGDGVFEGVVPPAKAGSDYLYVIDGEHERPDPVSRFQPYGVHGPSRVIDPHAFVWSDKNWKGLPLQNYVFYELHIGTFSEEGTFDGAIEKLSYLKELGVTAVEIMPVAEFPGSRNWGYDGVHLYAPHSAYGGPEGLKRLVNACHDHGLACVLDVVYNHLGPEGNYLGQFGPYFSSRYRTPWGDAINFDDHGSDPVRDYFIQNALYWLTEYHVDALRLDAIHGIFDFSAQQILAEMSLRVRAEMERRGRRGYLIAESDLNDTRVIREPGACGYGMDAQWSDDFHHSVQALLTGSSRGYFSDFGSQEDLAKAIREGFVYDGRHSRHRQRRHGSSSAGVSGEKLVICIQNHDQVANGSGGDRVSHKLSPEGQKLEAALLLCTPNLPLLFQGQEYGELAPFHYFVSHSDAELVAAVQKGRREEFLSFDWGEKFLDPQSEDTFKASKLNWSRRSQAPHREIELFYKELLRLRSQRRSLGNCRKDLTRVISNDEPAWLMLERGDPSGERALCVFNLSEREQSVALPANSQWELQLHSSDARFGGSLNTSGLGAAPGAATLPGFGVAIYLANV